MRRYGVVMLAVLLCLLSACGDDTPIETTIPEPSESLTPVTDPVEEREPHIQEWFGWEYEDPDVKWPTLETDPETGDTVMKDPDSGEELPPKDIDGTASDVVKKIREAGMDNGRGWWQNDDYHYCRYGLENISELEYALNDIGYSIEQCPPNSVSNGDGFTMTVRDRDGVYEIIVVIEQ